MSQKEVNRLGACKMPKDNYPDIGGNNQVSQLVNNLMIYSNLKLLL